MSELYYQVVSLQAQTRAMQCWYCTVVVCCVKYDPIPLYILLSIINGFYPHGASISLESTQSTSELNAERMMASSLTRILALYSSVHACLSLSVSLRALKS